MHKILAKLHKDHMNFAKLIAFLDKQLTLLEDCKHPDIVTTLDAIKYMKNYPDVVHHPLENVVFEYYLKNYQEVREEVLQLLEEHQEIPVLTDKLLATLEAVLADEPQDRQVLCNNLKAYLSIQKEHMDSEEASIFPMLDSKLDDKDWENIKSELADVEDPLFGKQVGQTYRALQQHIQD